MQSTATLLLASPKAQAMFLLRAFIKQGARWGQARAPQTLTTFPHYALPPFCHSNLLSKMAPCPTCLEQGWFHKVTRGKKEW